MDINEEYHDPDYPEAPVCIKEEPPSQTEEEKVEKIREIIRREFLNELEIRENEVMLIDQRMTTSRRLLHRLRYALVSSYYQDQKLQLANGQVQDEIALQTEPRTRAEVSTVLRDGQRRLHPSVRKLLGKQTVDLEEIFKIRGPRNKTRKDYSAMLQKRNYTISADTTKTLRPDRKPDEMEIAEDPSTSRPKKIPRHLEPKPTNVLTLDEVTRNKTKYRYRIVIGNTSKFAPPASRLDRSTHKWLLYVRGAPPCADLSQVLTAVSVRLHHSYAPHHTVHIDKPPYHVSRRGWGEFPAKVELHFALPERNRPATVEHTIKLDRNYTGLQMLGAETVVDVWLYSTPEMLPYQFKEDEQPEPITQEEPVIEQKPEIVTETIDNAVTHTDNWMEFFSKETTEVDVDEMIIKPIKKEQQESDPEPTTDNNVIENIPEPEIFSEVNIKTEKEWDPDYKADADIPNEILSQPTSPKKRIVKYIDPTTGKIYYLEMDRNLDLSKVQEIVINNTKTAKISPIKSNGLKSFRKKKGGVSLLKPEVKNMLKNTENNVKLKSNLAHIENDHCYLATPRRNDFSTVAIKKEKTLYDCLCLDMSRLNTVRAGVNYLIKKIPLISDQARDTDFVKYFPFVVETEEKYWKLDFAKRRNIEWSRAKLINRILTEHLKTSETIWRTKQILLYSRLHGYYPIRSETINIQSETHEWSSWNDLENHRNMESSIKELYPNPSDISTLSIFDSSQFNRLNSESEVISLSDDEEIDVMSCVERTRVKTEVCDNTGLTVLPVDNDEDRLRFLFIERKCADIGIELRNEDVGNGYSYSAVHAVLLSALREFAGELLRAALAVRHAEQHSDTVWAGSSSSRTLVSARHVYVSTLSSRLRPLSAADVAARKHHQRTL